MHYNSRSTGKRLLSLLLALLLTLGLFPITPASAADVGNSGMADAVDRNGSVEQWMAMTQIKEPRLKNSKGRYSVSDWFAVFTDAGGNKGYGYCNNHTLPAPNNGAGAKMTVKKSAAYDKNIPLKNALFVGYDGSERTAAYATRYLWEWCKAIYGADKVGDWMGLTDGEFQKATQLATWMLANGFDGAAKPQVSIEGQYGYKGGSVIGLDNKNAYEYFYLKDNPSASARRVFNAAKGIVGYAMWLADKNFDFERDSNVGLTMRPIRENTFTGAGFWNASAKALDFTSAAPNGKGFLKDAIDQLGPDGPIRDEGDYYVIDYMAVSGTQIYSVWSDTKFQNIAPNGVIIERYTMDDLNILENMGVEEYIIEKLIDSINAGSKYPDYYYFLNGVEVGDGFTKDSDPHSKTKPTPPNGGDSKDTSTVCYFKVKIPKTLADTPNSVSFDLNAKVMTYRIFLAEAGSKYQGFGIVSTTKTLIEKGLINWDHPLPIGTTPPPGGPGGPDDPPDDEQTILRKQGSDGKPLQGAIFRFQSIGGETDKNFETNSTGTIDAQWTNPEKADTYLAPGEYRVTEVKAPPGYNIDDTGSRSLLLNEDGTFSGELIFVNTKKPYLEIFKTDPDGVPLAGARFKVWKDGKFLGEIGPTTDPQGKIEFTGMPEGDGTEGPGLTNGYYEFQEIVSPGGFLLSDEKKGIHIDLSTMNGEYSLAVNSLTFVNHPWPEIVILKRDKETGDVLKGASFNIQINGQDFGTTMVTDDKGEIRINYETYKKFLTDESSAEGWTVTVTEIKAPDLYNRDLQEGGTYTQTQQIKLGQSLTEFVFEDTHYKDITVTLIISGWFTPCIICSPRPRPLRRQRRRRPIAAASTPLRRRAWLS